MSFSEQEYQQLLRNGQGRIAPKPSKYKAVKTTVDGITFDSKSEAKRYHELRLMERAGLIVDLVVHPEFDLEVCDVSIGVYEGDFSYYPCHHNGPFKGAPIGPIEVEDVKGMATLPLAKWKQKHLKAQYGIVVREIR